MVHISDFFYRHEKWVVLYIFKNPPLTFNVSCQEMWRFFIILFNNCNITDSVCGSVRGKHTGLPS